jgi:hypothetical protein
MALSIVGTLTATNSNTSPTGTWTATPADGDILLASFSMESYDSVARTLGSGWNELVGTYSPNNNWEGMSMYWKRQVGAGSTSDVPVTAIAVANRWITLGIIIRGAVASGDPYDAYTAKEDNNATKTSTAISITDTNEKVYVGSSVDNGDNAVSAAQFTDNATGVTTIDTGGGTGGAGMHGALWYKIVTPTTGSKTASITHGGTNHSGVIMFAVIKDPTVVPTGRPSKSMMGVG